MIYFIFWVVFLLLAIAAVPLAMMMENKARQSVAYDDGTAGDGAVMDAEAVDADAEGEPQPQEPESDGFGAAEAADDFGGDPLAGDPMAGDPMAGGDFGGAEFGGDDFSAFEELN